MIGGRAKVAYLVPGQDAALPALLSWLRKGLRVHVADRDFRMGDNDCPRGTLILRTSENPETLHEAMKQAAKDHGLRILASDTGLVSDGAQLGGPHVKWVRPPKAALLVDRPASYAAGHTWYLFDQVWRYPITRVAGSNWSRLELHDYNVLVLPDGDYSGREGLGEKEVTRLRQWISEGGTLILIKRAASWATQKPVALLSVQAKNKPASTPSRPRSRQQTSRRPTRLPRRLAARRSVARCLSASHCLPRTLADLRLSRCRGRILPRQCHPDAAGRGQGPQLGHVRSQTRRLDQRLLLAGNTGSGCRDALLAVRVPGCGPRGGVYGRSELPRDVSRQPTAFSQRRPVRAGALMVQLHGRSRRHGTAFGLKVLAGLLALLAVADGSRAAEEVWKASGSQAAVATGGAESADAALAVLQDGGNAVDAAVAAMLVLSVTDSKNFCFGGEVPILVYDAQRKVVEVICGQGGAPRLATVAYFQEHHEGRIPADGHPATAAVPGAWMP